MWGTPGPWKEAWKEGLTQLNWKYGDIHLIYWYYYGSPYHVYLSGSGPRMVFRPRCSSAWSFPADGGRWEDLEAGGLKADGTPWTWAKDICCQGSCASSKEPNRP